MGYKNPDQQREYQRKWVAARKAEFFADKECGYCGSSENLELDHVDPSKKVSHSIWSWSQERRVAEIAKCQILCEDCHKNKTYQDRVTSYGMRPPTHGYPGMAKHCSCDLCREYKRLDKAKSRARIKARTAIGAAW